MITPSSLLQAMSAERIEKAAAAGYAEFARHIGVPDDWDKMPPVGQVAFRASIKAALRAAYPELADGRSWIAPWEATPAMLEAGGVASDHPHEFAEGPSEFGKNKAIRMFDAMRDAHLSRGSDE